MNLAGASLSIFKRDAFLYATRTLTSILVARSLGPDLLGVAAVLALLPSYAESVGRLKFDVAAVYYLGKGKYTVEEVVAPLNIIALATSGIILCTGLWHFDYLYSALFSRTELDITSLVYLVFAQIPLQFLSMNYTYLLLHLEKIAAYNRMVVLNALVSSLGAVVLVVFFGLGLWGVIGASVLATGVSLLFGIAAVGRVSHRGRLLNLSLLRDLVSYGYKLYLGGLVGHLQVYITNLIVAVTLVPAQVAFFSLARNFGLMLDRVPAALNTVLFPQLTKVDQAARAGALSARAFRMILLLMAPIGALACLLIYPAVFVLYGKEFLPLVGPFLILIPGVVGAGATSPFLQYFLSIDRADLGVTLPLLPLGIQAVSGLYFAPMLGPEGAALAFSLGSLASAALAATFFLRLSPCTVTGDLLIQRQDIHYLAQFLSRETRALARGRGRRDEGV